MVKSDPFYFGAQNKIGIAGEELYSRKYPKLKPKVGCKDPDFILPDGRMLELKTEASYCLSRKPHTGKKNTLNLAVERFSSKESRTPGGPWQALGKGAHLYVHFFPCCDLEFMFHPQDLISLIEPREGKYRQCPAFNKTYTTWCWLIPVKEIAEIALPPLKDYLKAVRK